MKTKNQNTEIYTFLIITQKNIEINEKYAYFLGQV